MTTDRSLHTATLLPNGTALVAAGYSYTAFYRYGVGMVSNAEIFYP